MNIVLIGMRGTGKTTIGNMLSQSLKRDFIETDELIAKKSGRTIADLVNTFGWNYFRDLESRVVQEVSLRSDAVISTGGGVIMRDENVNELKGNGFLVLLTANIDTMVRRLAHDADRPSLTAKQTMREEISEVLRLRKSQYKKACQVQIATDDQSLDAVVQKILEIVKERNI